MLLLSLLCVESNTSTATNTPPRQPKPLDKEKSEGCLLLVLCFQCCRHYPVYGAGSTISGPEKQALLEHGRDPSEAMTTLRFRSLF